MRDLDKDRRCASSLKILHALVVKRLGHQTPDNSHHWYDELCARQNGLLDLLEYRLGPYGTAHLSLVIDATLGGT